MDKFIRPAESEIANVLNQIEFVSTPLCYADFSDIFEFNTVLRRSSIITVLQGRMAETTDNTPIRTNNLIECSAIFVKTNEGRVILNHAVNGDMEENMPGHRTDDLAKQPVIEEKQ